jgi:hypothetical protein
MKYLFVDIRKSDEVFSRHFENQQTSKRGDIRDVRSVGGVNGQYDSTNYEVYNIPIYMIRFNKDMIEKHTQYYDEIYIVCNSSSRSQFIKDKYFSGYPNIKVNKSLQFDSLNMGTNNVTINNKSFAINVVGSNGFNIYSILRITQILLGTVILLFGGYTYFNIYTAKNNSAVSKISLIPLTILLLFGLMALTNGLTSTCSITTIFIDYLN